MHGFGVGAHQFSNLLPLLSDTHQVWALDLLGQGLSWPSQEALAGELYKAARSLCALFATGVGASLSLHGLLKINMRVGAEEELRLSIDTWTELLADFITEVIREPCYVVGNSLGGYLAAQLAATRQHLCR